MVGLGAWQVESWESSPPVRAEVRNPFSCTFSSSLTSPALFPPLTPQSLIGKLIFEYCTHHGYWDTAALVARDALCGAAGVSEAQRAEQAGLQRISELIRRGALDEALALCEQLQPGIFALRPDIHFRLLAQKLAGMVGGAGERTGGGRDGVERAFGGYVVTDHCKY